MKKITQTLVIIIILFTIVSFLKIIINRLELVDNNEDFINMILKDTNYYKKYKKDYNNIFSRFIKITTNIDMKNPSSIITNDLYIKKVEPKMYFEKNEYKPVISNNPIVYIYNTHQKESYNKETFKDYNITPNVVMASHIIEKRLNEKGIETKVNNDDITTYLEKNKLDYSYSYKASRHFIESEINDNYKLIIDLHRDSIKRKYTTITINNKKYARILFVVGLKNKGYQNNLKVMEKLNEISNNMYPKLSRGIMKKSGKGVNGVYNQDLNKNIILIELGSIENNMEEILNTSIALSNIIEKYLEEI